MQEKKDHPTTIDEYIIRYPEDVQHILAKIRAVIKESAPEATEKISYQMPTFYLNGNLIYFGAYKSHIGLYPRTPEMDANIEGLSAYKGTKGSIHLPLDEPIPYELISRIVKFRAEENLKNKANSE